MMEYLKNEKKHVFYSILLGVIGSLIGISIFGLSGYMISLSYFEPPIFVILLIISMIKLFGMTKGGLKYLERLLSHNSTFKLISRMRTRYFESTLFDDRDRHNVRFIQTLSRHFEDIENYYITIIYPYVVALLMSIVLILLSALLNTAMVVITLFVTLLMLGVLPFVFSRWDDKIDAEYDRLDTSAFLKTYQFIHGYTDLFIDGKNKDVKESIDNKLKSISRNKNRGSFKDSMIDFLSGMVQLAIITAVIILMQDDHIFLIPMLILLVISFFEVLTPVVDPASQYSNTKQKVGHIESEASNTGSEPEESEPDLTLKNVSYKYPAGAYEALSDVSITVADGQKHAIIGSSGSGKTTLLNRLIEKKDMGVMPQYLDFYNASIRDNLTMFGHFKISDEAIKSLLAEFELEHFDPDDFVYYTGQLSGGEQKRLHFIRMIIEDEDWWILDEPSAKLNKELQEKVWQSILDRQTVIVSTHDLSYIHEFDRIHFIENGRIIESGAYEDLMERRGAVHEAVKRFRDYL